MIRTMHASRKALQVAFLGLCLLLMPSLAAAIDPPGNPRGTSLGDGSVQWEWDWTPGAYRYDVIINDQYVGSTNDHRFTSTNLQPGSNTLSVKAIDMFWQYSAPTPTISVNVEGNSVNLSESGTDSSGGRNGSFGPPQGVRGTETGQGQVLWQWNSVDAAVSYELTIDGWIIERTNELSLTSANLWPGDHSLTVKAIDSNNNFSDQSATAKILVSGSYDGSNPNQSDSIGGSSSAPEPAAVPVQNDGSNNPPPAPPPPANDNGLIDPASWTKEEVLQETDWELTFSDEFESNQLNQARWHGQLRWDGEHNGERYEYRIINSESQMYVNPISKDPDHLEYLLPQHNPLEFDGSRLAIRAVRNPLRERDLGIDHGALRDVARQQHFLSGSISTFDKFYQKYGRFEARIKIPAHVGTFPAFWLYHQARKWERTQRTEIDIMENLGHAPEFVYNTFHYHRNVSATYSGDAEFVTPSPSGQYSNGGNWSDNYHVYAVEWSPGYARWMIDGVQISELYDPNLDFEELYININLAMGGAWTNYPTTAGGLGRPGNERYPADYDLTPENFTNPALEIDYVRVYKRR